MGVYCQKYSYFLFRELSFLSMIHCDLNYITLYL